MQYKTQRVSATTHALHVVGAQRRVGSTEVRRCATLSRIACLHRCVRHCAASNANNVVVTHLICTSCALALFVAFIATYVRSLIAVGR